MKLKWRRRSQTMGDIQIGNRIVGTITLNEREVRSEGGPHDARIVLPLTVTMHSQPAEAMLVLTELRCSLHLTSFTSASNQVGQTVPIHLLENMNCRSVPGGPVTEQIEVRLPLTQQLIVHLET